MLRIYFGDDMDFVYNPKIYFNYNYDPEWFNDPFIRNMVEDIDKSRVIYKGVIDSPYLGIITPKELSGGVRTLMLMYKTDEVYNASACGDNCSKWLLEIGKMKDLTVRLGYIMEFIGGDIMSNIKVHIYSAKIDYNFELTDKITLVSNESCLGEQVLTKMIEDSYNEPKAVHDESDIRCMYFSRGYHITLKDMISIMEQEIMFIEDFDEHFNYDEFLDIIKDSKYYFVLFTRDTPGNVRKMVVDKDKTTDKKVYITLV